MIAKLLLIIILVILTIFLMFGNMSSFLKTKHDNMTDVHNFLENSKEIISENNENNENNEDNEDNEDKLNNSFNKLNNKIKKQEETNNVISSIWSPNNTLESMITTPCLGDVNNVNRLTCFAAPEWWYPVDKYNSDNFRSKYYGDFVNPIYNYLGNAQDVYWNFKSVTEKLP